MNVTILDDTFDTLRTLPCFAKLDGHEVTVFNDHVQDTDLLVKRLAETDALVLFRERTRIEGALLDRLPRLKLISQRSVFPHIDVPACTRNGVLLCSKMPESRPSFAAAELTWGLIIAAMRDLPRQMAALRDGHWQSGVGRTLQGLKLGIHSYGRIGRTVASYGAAFGMRVVVFGGDTSCRWARADGVEIAESREAFFWECDVISLHIRLTPETRGTITAADMARMKPDALLVNTSRAGLIEKESLVEALKAGRPGFAAIDVFEEEPVMQGEPLLELPNVIATPHIGYATREEYELQFSDIFEQVVAYAERSPIHMINPDVWPNV